MEHEEALDKCRMLCLRCGEVLNELYPQEVCTFCGKPIDTESYKDIFRYTYYAIHYGYQYRNYYERHALKPKKEVSLPKLMSPDEVWLLIGIPAIAGVLGNLTADAVKVLCKKIYEKARKKPEAKMASISDAELERFVRCLIDYTYKIPHPRKRIAAQIEEEIKADAFTWDKECLDEFSDCLSDEGDIDPQKRKMASAIFTKAGERYKTEIRRKPSKDAIENLWSDIE